MGWFRFQGGACSTLIFGSKGPALKTNTPISRPPFDLQNIKNKIDYQTTTP